MRPLFSAALVDLDGLLTNTEHLGQQTMAETWAESGFGRLDSNEQALYVGRPDDEVFAELAVRRGLTVEQAHVLHKHYRRRYLERLRNHHLDALPGVREGLKKLADHHPLALVTGSTREQAEIVLERLDLAGMNLWKAKATSDDVERGKPAPAPYLWVAAQLGVPIHHCLVVEDSVPGVLAGRGAGASVLHVGTFHPQTSLIADRHIEQLDRVDTRLLEDLWRHRPLPAVLDSSALRDLGKAIAQGTLPKVLAIVLKRNVDLWHSFETATVQPPGALDEDTGKLWRLWVEGRPVSRSKLRPILKEPLLLRLVDSELLENTAVGEVGARLRLLAIDGLVLLKEPPRLLASGRPLSCDTYLESSSLHYLAAVIRHLRRQSDRRPSQVLEIGTGTGLGLLRVLTEFSGAQGLGIDLDGRAIHLARANGALNSLDHRLEFRQGDLFSPLAEDEQFELVLFHPPYRIMPDEIPYPDPLSRYGTGSDGLGVIDRFLGGLRDHLAPGGEALLFFELPHSTQKPVLFEERLRGTTSDLVLDFRQTGPLVPATEIARTGAEKCLEGNSELHRERILEAYTAIGADNLRPVLLRVSGGR